MATRNIEKICLHNKFGYCKYKEQCKYRHIRENCEREECDFLFWCKTLFFFLYFPLILIQFLLEKTWFPGKLLFKKHLITGNYLNMSCFILFFFFPFPLFHFNFFSLKKLCWKYHLETPVPGDLGVDREHPMLMHFPSYPRLNPGKDLEKKLLSQHYQHH